MAKKKVGQMTAGKINRSSVNTAPKPTPMPDKWLGFTGVTSAKACFRGVCATPKSVEELKQEARAVRIASIRSGIPLDPSAYRILLKDHGRAIIKVPGHRKIIMVYAHILLPQFFVGFFLTYFGLFRDALEYAGRPTLWGRLLYRLRRLVGRRQNA